MNDNLRARLQAAMAPSLAADHVFVLPLVIQEQIQQLGESERGLVRAALVRLRKQMIAGHAGVRAVRTDRTLSPHALVRSGQWVFELDYSPQAMGQPPRVMRISVILGQQMEQRRVTMACLSKDLG